MDWAKLSPRIGSVIEKYGHLLLRIKVVIRTKLDDRPLVLHGVQRTFHAPVWLNKWPSEPKFSLVAIGSEGATPAINELRKGLMECVA
jgi:G3E family GTPase